MGSTVGFLPLSRAVGVEKFARKTGCNLNKLRIFYFRVSCRSHCSTYSRTFLLPSCYIHSHFSNGCRFLDFNHLKSQVVDSHLVSRVMVFVVVDVVVSVVQICLAAADAVGCGDPHAFRKIWEINSVLSCLGVRNDGQEAVSPLDLLWDVGGPDLTGRASRLSCSLQKDHQLKVLMREGISWQLIEWAWSVDHMVEGQRANKKQVILPDIDHKVDVHLVQNDGFSVWRRCRPQQLAVNLAADQ